jgi:hypothetical protein
VLVGVVAFKTGDRSNQFDAIIWQRVRAKEIVLCQIPYKAVPAEKQGKRLDDRCFASVVASDKHYMLIEA